jgi:hypothetical protein
METKMESATRMKYMLLRLAGQDVEEVVHLVWVVHRHLAIRDILQKY